MYKITFLLSLFAAFGLVAQTNISITTGAGTNVLNGSYNPSTYSATNPITDHAKIACELDDLLSSDSLLSSLEILESFYTRHTYSDTTSATIGIGAARRWVHSKLTSYSSRNENRLEVAYLNFDQPTGSCGPANDLKNVLGILPGTDPQSEIVLVEAHMDSRCEGVCDDTCFAPGVDDNASGTALVLELARVMSRFSFEHTIVFMLTVGEEQGLLGSAAMAQYCQSNNIAIKAVQNNDVIGGIVCGESASPPGCDPNFSVDSTRVRMYASPSFLQQHQGFARTVKMYYDEKMKPQAKVPMAIEIVNQEDRIGRGGDHIPFRQRGFTSMRFSSAHEHGDAGVNNPNYNDHQHTGRDVLGEDLNNDGKLDTFFVDVNYLRRNTFINGVSLAMLALGPEVPQWNLVNDPAGLQVQIANGTHPEYRVGVRAAVNNTDFDALYRFTGSTFTVPGLQSGNFYYISVAAIDSNKVMSPFSKEERAQAAVTTSAGTQDILPYSLNCFLFSINEESMSLQKLKHFSFSVIPNPTSGDVVFDVRVTENASFRMAEIIITDSQGREIERLNSELKFGENRIEHHLKAARGIYYCRLEVDGQLVESRKVIVER